MKIKIGPYPNRAICNLHTNYMNKKYGYVDWPEYKQKGLRVKAQPFAEAWREQAEDIIQSIYNCTINLFLDRREQTVKIRIDRWDTWSMDHTLAPIILPMLKQLKETKHGAPWVAVADVPRELRPSKKQLMDYQKDGTTDPKFFERWDWVLDEMIYAFDCKVNKDDVYMRFNIKKERAAMDAEQERISKGFRLFGRYYENLWD
jgi:hypothetical protein